MWGTKTPPLVPQAVYFRSQTSQPPEPVRKTSHPVGLCNMLISKYWEPSYKFVFLQHSLLYPDSCKFLILRKAGLRGIGWITG